jgi:hypothetical protein
MTNKKLDYIKLYRVHLDIWMGFELTTLVVIGTDCIGSCKSNHHTTTTTPQIKNNKQQWVKYGTHVWCSLTWYRHFKRNGGLNKILKRQTSPFHYGSKFPAVTITVFITIPQFSGCWLILSVYILMSFDFPFVRLFGVR